MRAVRKIPDHIHDPRGDQKMTENYAEKLQIGKTVIYIHDDFAPKTAEEQERIDREIVEAAWPIIEELVAKGEAV